MGSGVGGLRLLQALIRGTSLIVTHGVHQNDGRNASTRTGCFRHLKHLPSTLDGIPAQGIPDCTITRPAQHFDSLHDTTQGTGYGRCAAPQRIWCGDTPRPLPIGLHDKTQPCRQQTHTNRLSVSCQWWQLDMSQTRFVLAGEHAPLMTQKSGRTRMRNCRGVGSDRE